MDGEWVGAGASCSCGHGMHLASNRDALTGRTVGKEDEDEEEEEGEEAENVWRISDVW